MAKKTDEMLEVINNILNKHLKPGILEAAVGDEKKEMFYLEAMEAMVSTISGRMKIDKQPALERILDEIVKAIKSFHDHDVPETINHLRQAQVLVLELREKIIGKAA